MRTGISTACLYPTISEESLEILLKSGYQCFEFFINAEVEAEKPFLKQLKSIAGEYGGSFVSVHPFTAAMESMYFFSEYERRADEGKELYKKFFSAASYLGAEFLVLHGQHISRGGKYILSEDEYFERYFQLRKIGLEYGIRLCQENVQGFRSSSPEFIGRMCKALKNDCDFVFDIKQTILASVDKYEMLDAMGDRLSHVHLSDSTADSSCLLPGDGNFDMLMLRNKLLEVNYRGNVITEVYQNAVKGIVSLEKSRIYTENIFELA